jgi:hypothetical protein
MLIMMVYAQPNGLQVKQDEKQRNSYSEGRGRGGLWVLRLYTIPLTFKSISFLVSVNLGNLIGKTYFGYVNRVSL